MSREYKACNALVMLRRTLVAHRLIIRNKPRCRGLRKDATGSETASQRSQIERIESRLPRFLQRIVTPLRQAPISHVTAFVILHEITAVVPLFGLAAAFHYSNWLPPFISEWKWVSDGTEKFGGYLRKRGWITEDKRSGKWWGRGEGSVKIVVEFGAAYAITKALMPLRLLLSAWMTPWFARWTVIPFMGFARRAFGSKKTDVVTKSPAGGTNAVGAGVMPKDPRSSVK